MSKYYTDDTFMWENKLMGCPEEDYDRVPREDRGVTTEDPLVWRITHQSGPAVSRKRAIDELLADYDPDVINEKAAAKLDQQKALDEMAQWAQANGLYDDYEKDAYLEYELNRKTEELNYDFGSLSSDFMDALDRGDKVHSPSHYNTGSIECIEAIEEALTPEEMRGYFKGNCLKYLWRERYKNGVEDLEKAYWYLGRLIDNLED